MKVLLDSEQFIVNAAVLRAEDLHQQHVRCLACAQFGFFRWPSGWDGHAQVCKGLSDGTIEERKVEFKRALGHLFLRGREEYRDSLKETRA